MIYAANPGMWENIIYKGDDDSFSVNVENHTGYLGIHQELVKTLRNDDLCSQFGNVGEYYLHYFKILLCFCHLLEMRTKHKILKT